MAHGYILSAGPPLAAALIYAAMKIVLLALKDPREASDQPGAE